MKRANKIIVSIALALVLCTGAALLAQAFFQAFTKDATGNVTITPPSKAETDISIYYVKVATEAELIEATKDVTYNSNKPYSEAVTTVDTQADEEGEDNENGENGENVENGENDAPDEGGATTGQPSLAPNSRCIILLTADIKLNSDLLITRDCHIDLGMHTLDTNGYKVTVFHTYTGAFVISNGTITSTKTTTVGDTTNSVPGALIVNTPNAAVMLDTSVTIGTANSKNLVTVTNRNDFSGDDGAAKRTAQEALVRKAALSMICAHLSNNLGEYGIYGLLNSDNCQLPVYSEFGCDHDNGCCFTVGDPDLPYWFFGYHDLKITYTTKTNADGSETLTATVVYGTNEEPEANKSSVDFVVHDLTGNTTAMKKAAACIVIKSLDMDGDGNYSFSTPVLLPKKIYLSGTTSVDMKYSTSPEGAYNATTSIYTPSEQEGGSLSFFPEDFTNDDSISIDTISSITAVTENDYTKANRVIQYLFGGSIVITKDNDTYSSQSLLYPDEIKTQYGITGITFTLSNNDEFHDYEIYTNSEGKQETLRVTQDQNGNVIGAPENRFDSVTLIASVTMQSGTVVSIGVPIRCQMGNNNSNQVDLFLPYFYYFNRLFIETTSGNNTYKTFRMPNVHPSGKPWIQFVVVNKQVNDATGEVTYSRTEPDANNVIDLGYLRIWFDTNTDEWVFEISPEEIGLADREVILAYNYKFSESATSWSHFPENQTNDLSNNTLLTVPGVVNKNNLEESAQNPYTGFGDIPNENLYEFLYSIYHSEVYDESTYDSDADYILASRLKYEVDMKENATADGWEVTSNIILNFEGKHATFVNPYSNADFDPFEGLELLDNVLSINLKNSGITIEELQYVAGMENLKYLNLASNNLSDGSDFNSEPDVLGQLSALTHLEVLHLEDNVLYDFTFLSELPALQKAYVYDNSPGINWFDGGILELIDTTLTTALRDTYGSTGAVNVAEYSSICHRVKIYNTSATTPFSPDLGGANDFSSLANLEYQDKIPHDADIDAICRDMQDELGAYGIASNVHTCKVLVKGVPTGTDQYLINRIQFLSEQDSYGNEYIILRYYNHVAVDNYKGSSNAAPMQVAVEYSIDFRYPVTRLPEEE